MRSQADDRKWTSNKASFCFTSYRMTDDGKWVKTVLPTYIKQVINVVTVVLRIKQLSTCQWCTAIRCTKAAGNHSNLHYYCNRLGEMSVNKRQAIHCHSPQHGTISLSLDGTHSQLVTVPHVKWSGKHEFAYNKTVQPEANSETNKIIHYNTDKLNT